jgi:hydroxymethylbilane synthase
MRIGTRGSKLALWQANTVARLIREVGGPECEIVVIRTSGDERAGPPDPPSTPSTFDTSSTVNVKSMFVKEIEEALLDRRVDLAVHSAKDLPAELPEGLRLAAALEREDPRDALLLPHGSTATDFASVKRAIGSTGRIGTSSVRRIAQLRVQFPNAEFITIRGNVDTRLRKLDASECDVIMLATAGLKRLGFAHRISVLVPTEVCVPAPGQGIVAVEVSERVPAGVQDLLKAISDADAEVALTAERSVVAALGGGCQMPLGALARVDGQELTIEGIVASLDGRTVIRAQARGHRGGAAALGDKLAAQLVARGAQKLLSEVGAD